MTYDAFAPDGTKIQGQVHTIAYATAEIAVFLEPDASTDDHIDFAGYTEVNWDSQQARHLEGELIYEDENGNIWKASELTFKETA